MKNVVLHHGLTKQEYYDILCESSVQINTSLQDWVSYTLLEATCANCQLIYPNERSFPETFSGMADFFGAVPCLNVNNPRQVAERIKILLDNAEEREDENRENWEVKRKLIVDTHDQTWKRILYHMDMLPDKLRANFDPFRVYASQ
jgi:trehalose-6-phosphate synthase